MEIGLGNNKDAKIVKYQLLEYLLYINLKLSDAPML
jgi:hypothetical protein